MSKISNDKVLIMKSRVHVSKWSLFVWMGLAIILLIGIKWSYAQDLPEPDAPDPDPPIRQPIICTIHSIDFENVNDGDFKELLKQNENPNPHPSILRNSEYPSKKFHDNGAITDFHTTNLQLYEAHGNMTEPIQVCYIGISKELKIGTGESSYEYFRVIVQANPSLHEKELDSACQLAATLWNHVKRYDNQEDGGALTLTPKFKLRPLTQDPLDEIDSKDLEGTPDGQELYTNAYDKEDYAIYEHDIDIEVHSNWKNKDTDIEVHSNWRAHAKWVRKDKEGPIKNPIFALKKPTAPQDQEYNEIDPPWAFVENTKEHNILCEKYEEKELPEPPPVDG